MIIFNSARVMWDIKSIVLKHQNVCIKSFFSHNGTRPNLNFKIFLFSSCHDFKTLLGNQEWQNKFRYMRILKFCKWRNFNDFVRAVVVFVLLFRHKYGCYFWLFCPKLFLQFTNNSQKNIKIKKTSNFQMFSL